MSNVIVDEEPADVEALYCDHHNWLVSWFHRRLGNQETAADLAHDVFVRLLVKRALLFIHEPRAFLTVVAKGLIANFYRHRSLEAAYAESLVHWPEGRDLSTEQRAILLETLSEIDALLHGLPQQTRIIFLLVQLEGLTYEEIALQTKLSVRTVQRHVTRAFEHCLVAHNDN